jgi:Leucine-rich repeat (LRR) protein
LPLNERKKGRFRSLPRMNERGGGYGTWKGLSKRSSRKKEERQSGATELDLSWIELAELPESLGQLTRLESLNLNNNKLTGLPESLPRLSRLIDPRLNENAKMILPDWIGQFSRLQVIEVGGKNLTSLPDTLGGLSQITTLKVWGNPLMRVPGWLYKLTNRIPCIAPLTDQPRYNISRG